MIEQTLREIGFNEKEAEVYLEVMKRGRTTPAIVARVLGINRATVYSVAKNLVEKGVIAEDLGGTTMYLTAQNPDALERMVEREKRELLLKTNRTEQAIAELKNIPQGTQYAVPKIRFVEEWDIADFLERRSAEWDDSMLKVGMPVWWGFQDHTFVEHYGAWIEWYWKRAPEVMEVRLLSNQSQAEARLREKNVGNRMIRFWENDEEFTASTWAFGEYVVVIYTRERPFYLIEMHNFVMAQNMRMLFRRLWDQSAYITSDTYCTP